MNYIESSAEFLDFEIVFYLVLINIINLIINEINQINRKGNGKDNKAKVTALLRSSVSCGCSSEVSCDARIDCIMFKLCASHFLCKDVSSTNVRTFFISNKIPAKTN